jgi:hypothetical protein
VPVKVVDWSLVTLQGHLQYSSRWKTKSILFEAYHNSANLQGIIFVDFHKVMDSNFFTNYQLNERDQIKRLNELPIERMKSNYAMK